VEKMAQDHVVIGQLCGYPVLRIDDWEVFDFIDDHLTQHGLEYDHFTEENVEDRRLFVMHFRSCADLIRLREAMDLVDPEEIQRIWRINNQTSPSG
jgi:hypothetical protein